MKKLLLLIMILLSAAFVSASLEIEEDNIAATVNPGTVFSKQVSITNTESSPLAVTFMGLDLACISYPSEDINAIVQDVTIPAGATVPVSMLFSVSADQRACVYHGNIVATSGSLADGVTADITVNSIPSVSVKNTSIEILKNLSTITYMNIAMKNTGNTDLSFIYQYSDFTRSGNVLALGGAGSTVIPLGATHYISIPIATDNTLPDGTYTSTLRLNGTVNKVYTLSAELRTPKLSLSLPDFTMPESERNTTITGTFRIENTGDYPLEGISLTTNAPAEYDVAINGVPNSLAAGESRTITISAFVPDDEKTTIHSIGTLFFDSDRITNSVPLKLNVKTKLQIKEVTVTIEGSSTTVDNNDELIDDTDTLPGSEFEVDLEICNLYNDDDFSISDISGTVTFEDINNGDDIEGDISEFDLDGDECEQVSVSFDDEPKISFFTDEGTYDMVIEIDGEDDEFDIDQADEMTIRVKVYREENAEIIFDSVRLAPSTVTCGASTDLEVTAYNIGDRDNDGRLRIYNSALGLDINRYFEVGDDTNDDCDAISEPDEECLGIDHIFRLSIPVVQSGRYPIEVTAFRDETRQTDKETVELVVNCGSTVPDETPTDGDDDVDDGTNGGTTPPADEDEDDDVIIVPRPDSGTSGGTTTGTPVKIRDISDTSNALWTIGLVAGIVIVVLLIVLIMMSILSRKNV